MARYTCLFWSLVLSGDLSLSDICERPRSPSVMLATSLQTGGEVLNKIIMINSKYLLVTLSIFAFLWSCEESVDPPAVTDIYPDLGLTLDDSLEAEIVAYYLDQTLSAIDSSFKRELYYLNYLRKTFRDSLPFLDNMRFGTPWVPNKILVGADDSTLAEMKAGTYQNWGSLPEELQPASIDYNGPSGVGVFYLYPGFHPVIASEYYEQYLDIRYAEAPTYLSTHGLSFTLAIIHSPTGNKYLFRGTISPYDTIYYLFEYSSQEPIYIGQIQSDTSVVYREFVNEFNDLGFP